MELDKAVETLRPILFPTQGEPPYIFHEYPESHNCFLCEKENANIAVGKGKEEYAEFIDYDFFFHPDCWLVIRSFLDFPDPENRISCSFPEIGVATQKEKKRWEVNTVESEAYLYIRDLKDPALAHLIRGATKNRLRKLDEYLDEGVRAGVRKWYEDTEDALALGAENNKIPEFIRKDSPTIIKELRKRIEILNGELDARGELDS